MYLTLINLFVDLKKSQPIYELHRHISEKFPYTKNYCYQVIGPFWFSILLILCKIIRIEKSSS